MWRTLAGSFQDSRRRMPPIPFFTGALFLWGWATFVRVLLIGFWDSQNCSVWWLADRPAVRHYSTLLRSRNNTPIRDHVTFDCHVKTGFSLGSDHGRFTAYFSLQLHSHSQGCRNAGPMQDL